MPLVDHPEIRKQRVDFAAKQGAYWTKVHADANAKLPAGITVIINVVTGEYVTGEVPHKTQDEYWQRLGQGRGIALSFEVGRPLVVGGGLWRS